MVRALESVLDHGETPPGNWWPVGNEALAMLAHLPLRPNPYEDRLQASLRGIVADPAAAAEDRRWAESYGDSASGESADGAAG